MGAGASSCRPGPPRDRQAPTVASMSLDRNKGCSISAESAQGGLTNTDESDGSIASLTAAMAYQGNPDLVGQPLTALFCSNRCPGDLILKTYDLARALRDASVPVIGGFQTPMEKECLRLLLRGDQPIVVCPARGIDNMRIPRDWRPAIDDGRLLILSPFPASIRRPTAAHAARRNKFVSDLAHSLLIIHAATGSNTEALAQQAAPTGKPLFTLKSPSNANLTELGAEAIRSDEMDRIGEILRVGGD